MAAITLPFRSQLPAAYCAPFSTISAPFSAIMIVAALVLAEVIVGITEASITRSRST